MRRTLPAASFLLVVTALAAPAGAQEADFDARVRFGAAACWLSDLDGDGVVDLAVSDPSHRRVASDWSTTGVTTFHSGATGEVLARVHAGEGERELGWNLVRLDDLDRDGHPELAIAAASSLRVISTVSLETRYDLALPKVHGSPIVAGPDLDGDGIGELALRVRADDGAARVTLRSGADGAELGSFAIDPTADVRPAASLAFVPDLDGDGREDVAVGSCATTDDSCLENRSRVDVHSSASGALLHRWTEPKPFRAFGAALVRLPDVDGDGVDDVAIGAPGRKPLRPRPGVRIRRAVATWGGVYVVSGATGDVLWKIRYAPPTPHAHAHSGTDGFGERLAFVRDGGGRPLLLVAVGRYGQLHAYDLDERRLARSQEGDGAAGVYRYVVHASAGAPDVLTGTANPWSEWNVRVLDPSTGRVKLEWNVHEAREPLPHESR